MVTVLAAALLTKPALKFELDVPDSVRPGETVKVRFVAVNQSDRPVVLTKLEPNGDDLGVRYDYDILQEGKRVERDARGNLIAQWHISPVIGPHVFVTLKPGERYTLIEEAFTYSFPKRPSLKSDWETFPKTPLTPGTYTARVKYAFHRKFDPKAREGSFRMTRKLSAEASALYHQTWTGGVEVVETFRVVAG
ncbi:MAG: hypothetical protein ACO1SV_13550 [Fimbriimonas sp.]